MMKIVSLLHPQLPVLSSRAVQLGSLYVRGLGNLLGASCASGGPLPNGALMPWHSFDGRLFHSKYLLAHGGTEETVLLDGDVSGDGGTKRGMCVCVCVCVCVWLDFKERTKFNCLSCVCVFVLFFGVTKVCYCFSLQSSCLSLFLRLREKLTETCRKRGRVLQSRPRAPEPGHRVTPGPRTRERHAGEM